MNLHDFPLIGRYPPPVLLLNTDKTLELLHSLDHRGVRHAIIVDATRRLDGMVDIKRLVDFLGGGKFWDNIVCSRYACRLIDALNNVRVDEIAYKNIPCLKLGEYSLEDIVELIGVQGYSAVPIVLGDMSVVGIVSDRQFIDLLSASHNFYVSLSEIMSSPLIAAKPSTRLVDAMKMLSSNNIRHLPILDEEKRPIGMLSARDIVRHFAREDTLDIIAKEGVSAIHSMPIAAIASKQVITLPYTADASKAIRTMRKYGISSIVITDESGKAIGIVTDRDIISKLPKKLGVDMFFDMLRGLIVMARVSA